MVSDDRRDYYAGALAIVIGAGATFLGFQLRIGTLTRMGPGFFPAVLGMLLIIIGALILVARAAEGRPAPAKADALHPLPTHVDYRGWGCIILSVVAFIALSQYAGLLPATFLCVFIAALGDRQAHLWSSLLLAAGITAVGWFLFSYMLQVQIPAIRGLLQ